MGFGIPELMVLLVIVLLIFGVNKLPEIGSGMGRAIQNFKHASEEAEEVKVSSRKSDKKENGKDSESESGNESDD